MRFSLRVQKKVTSITLRDNIVALWVVINEKADVYDLHGEIVQFVYDCLDKWDSENGKGLSDFITERMIRNILEKDDFKTYRRVLKILS